MVDFTDDIANTIFIFQSKIAFETDIQSEFIFFKMGLVLHMGHMKRERERKEKKKENAELGT